MLPFDVDKVTIILLVPKQPLFWQAFSHFLLLTLIRADSQVLMLANSPLHSILWYDEYHSFPKHLIHVVHIQHHQCHFGVVYHLQVEQNLYVRDIYYCDFFAFYASI